MCIWGNEVVIELPESIDKGKEHRTVSIDSCIAKDISELWDHGYSTLGCCCGHFKCNPSVVIDSGYSDKQVKRIKKIFEKSGKSWDVMQWKLVKV
jgi:hypothetical protein